MIPIATYRLQFHKGFPFEAALPLAPYLRRLGISHVYSSPILKARPGSMHGYDIVDHGVINPELGGEEGFRRLAFELRAHGIGLIVDIVPNHMAVDEGNRWWRDVLERGRESRFADFFDIDWDGLDGKVLLAVLGKPYWEALNAGEIKVSSEGGAPCLCHFGRHWPLRPEDRNIEANEYQSAGALHALLERQHYRLAWWRTANDTINWRRFFDVPDLIALKQEAPDVFELSHAKIFELYRAGLIDGVRVDHVDGLADPGAYCRRLRARLEKLGAERSPPDGHPYIVVEKILGDGEALPPDWGVAGTTGYDFMNDVSALQHEEAGAEPLSDLWHRFSRRPRQFEAEEILARGEIAQSSFESALERTVDAFYALAKGKKFARDITRPAIRRALVRILQHLRVYRTCATGRPGSPPAGAQFETALAQAAAAAGATDGIALNFIGDCFKGTGPDSPAHRSDAIRRFNQLSAPVAAKAVEDTAFYRYGRLLSRNDVGFGPGALSLSIPEFHRHMQNRAEEFPHALSATATHDHKRGEDARARLAVLSEIPEKWTGAVEGWLRMNAPHRPPSIDPADEYQLYQTLVSAWPFDLRANDTEGLKRFGVRVLEWQEKALREAKLRSSWLDPNLQYERDAQAFARAILDPSYSRPFLNSLCEFVEQIAPAGALNGVVQTALRCTLPGVPDCYQGAEFWDLSMVDPDNRRPVDYEPRIDSLHASVAPERLLADWRDGRVKQALIAALLQLRQRWPTTFAHGSYQPLALHGAQEEHVLAFARIHHDCTVLVAVPVHVASACRHQPHPGLNFWGNTTVKLPEALGTAQWEHMFDNSYMSMGAELGCSALFARFPVAVLVKS